MSKATTSGNGTPRATVSERDTEQLKALFDLANPEVGRARVAALEALLQRIQGADFTPQDIDAVVADIDRRVSEQVDEILHAPKFQELESAWRGLKFLVDGTVFHPGNVGNKVDFLDVRKEELQDDFADAPTLRSSRLCRVVLEEAYAQYGATPYGVMIGNYSFGPSAPDIKLLQDISNVASQAHAPFIAAAGPEFFGHDDFLGLPTRNNVSTEAHKKWMSFRAEHEAANFVGLTLPRFLLRSPYDPTENPVKSFAYREGIEGEHNNYLWGNAAFAFATRLNESFEQFGWCPNVIGPKSGGTVRDLPLHRYEYAGAQEFKPPTEIMLSSYRELELAKEGFIPLVWKKDSDEAAFFSANSTQKPPTFANTPEGKAAETNVKLGTQLPYLFLVTRLAHFINKYQHQQLGGSMSRERLERNLNDWVRQYVSDQEGDVGIGERPFRRVELSVEDIQGEPGWYRVKMTLQPRLKYMGAYFDLSLAGAIKPRR